MDQMIDNYKESDSDKEIARISVLNYIKEAYEMIFQIPKLTKYLIQSIQVIKQYKS